MRYYDACAGWLRGTELLNAVDSRSKKVELLKQGLSPGIEGL